MSMTPAATGQVQDPPTLTEAGALQDGLDPGPRILFVAMPIEQFVIPRAEPVRVPGHVYWPMAARKYTAVSISSRFAECRVRGA